jgi:hypothetical protein
VGVEGAKVVCLRQKRNLLSEEGEMEVEKEEGKEVSQILLQQIWFGSVGFTVASISPNCSLTSEKSKG